VREGLTLLGLLGPAYLVLTVAIFLPLLVMAVFSFLSETPLGSRTATLTLEHYLGFFRERFYLYLTWRSVLMGAHTTALCVGLGYPLAYILARTVPGRWREALFFLVIMPFWTNTLVRIYSWIIVLQPQGIVSWLLGGGPTGGILFTYPAIIVGLVHGYLPYIVLTLYVALQGIDARLLEAAQSLGANPIQTFLRVTLPLSLPGLLAGGILVFIPVTGSFVEPRLLGGLAGTVLGTIVEDQFVAVFNWPFGAAVSFMLLLTILVTFGLALRLRLVLSVRR